MPRFFFNLKDGVSIDDEDGSELSSVAEARLEAIRFGGSLLRDFPQHEKWTVTVKDKDGVDVVKLVLSVCEQALVPEASVSESVKQQGDLIQ